MISSLLSASPDPLSVSSLWLLCLLNCHHFPFYFFSMFVLNRSHSHLHRYSIDQSSNWLSAILFCLSKWRTVRESDKSSHLIEFPSRPLLLVQPFPHARLKRSECNLSATTTDVLPSFSLVSSSPIRVISLLTIVIPSSPLYLSLRLIMCNPQEQNFFHLAKSALALQIIFPGCHLHQEERSTLVLPHPSLYT